MTTRLLRTLAGGAALALTLKMSAGGSDEESPSSSASGGEALELVKEGTLTVCSEIPYKPFEYEENGEFTGFDIDLDRIRSRIGMVFQSFNLFPHLSVMRNLTIAQQRVAIARALSMDPT